MMITVNLNPDRRRRRTGWFYGRRVHALRPKSEPWKRDYHLSKKYGLTSSDVDAMIAQQGNACRACAERFIGTGRANRAPVVDHCHRTGRVRSILCNRCNRALGFFHEDAALLRALADYIEEF